MEAPNAIRQKRRPSFRERRALKKSLLFNCRSFNHRSEEKRNDYWQLALMTLFEPAVITLQGLLLRMVPPLTRVLYVV